MKHRLVIPVTALFAVVLTAALFQALHTRLGAERAVCVSAGTSFLVTVVIGIVFKLLGE